MAISERGIPVIISDAESFLSYLSAFAWLGVNHLPTVLLSETLYYPGMLTQKMYTHARTAPRNIYPHSHTSCETLPHWNWPKRYPCHAVPMPSPCRQWEQPPGFTMFMKTSYTHLLKHKKETECHTAIKINWLFPVQIILLLFDQFGIEIEICGKAANQRTQSAFYSIIILPQGLTIMISHTHRIKRE